MEKELRIIISGGGTGGHIFPAVSIANALKELRPDVKILFVGAEGRMEMQRVPDAGYEIKGLPIRGLKRPLYSLANIGVAIDYLKSKRIVKKIIKEFNPDAAVGVGGYASSATLDAAYQAGIPCLIQEQNSYAGVTNKMLAKKAQKICVAYDGMERFFPAEKIIKTGNPVRQGLLNTTVSKEEARKQYGLDPQKKTILLVGGSLGARTVNESVMSHLDDIRKAADKQFIWQTGKYYSKEIQERLAKEEAVPNLKVLDFISDMGEAYKAADLVVSRAGASSISEFCLIGKPVILVPSPNVAEDHQTKNAMALVNNGAALMVPDAEAADKLIPLALQTVDDNAQLESMSANVLKMALPDSAMIIAHEVLKLAGAEEETDKSAMDNEDEPAPIVYRKAMPAVDNGEASKLAMDNGVLKMDNGEKAAPALNDEATLDKYKSVYFVGAGGIGMSAIARYFLHRGLFTAGYDKTPTQLTEQLEKEGMRLHFTDDTAQIPEECKDPATTLVVYTPAIPDDHSELNFFRSNGFTIQKRAQVLGELTRAHKGLCVAGTHGKTTTSAMTAHILHQSHIDCNAFLGGITKNYGTNYILADSDFVVIEADEFDRSFHWLRPYVSVITAADPDHLDIYGTEKAYLESFNHYTSLIQPEGALIIHKGLKVKEQLQEGVRRYDYSCDEGDFHAENIVIDNGEITFDFISPIESVKGISLGQPVPVNIENAVAAMAMAQLAGCTAEELRKAMATFKGVDRRFDFKIKTPKVVMLSDYAHHPQEIYQSAKSIRELYKDRNITAIFQPHLYTRTRDFYKDFAASLSQLDKVVLTEIYPAREQPIEGVTSKLIYDNLLPGVEREMIHKDDVVEWVKSHDIDVLIILGAGDLDNYCPQIEQALREKYGITE